MTDQEARLTALKERFAQAHLEGMDSLKRGDLEGFSEAVREERAVIDEQADEIDSVKKTVG
jgi:hypothetical protein